jgi:catechol 2,3-dioxygenase-like lactoylglutathione lyase family enzyme
MITGIDHLVIAVPELEKAATAYRDLGFTVVPGGRHPVGTYNVLISFADGSYIELISFYRDNPDHRWWNALQQGGGLVDYCLQTDDLIADTRAFRAAGVDIADPTSQSRERPDGYQLHWVFSLARGRHRGVAPFLIKDETPREERIPRETTHANQVTGIGLLRIATTSAELPAVRHWYAEVLKQAGEDVVSAEAGGNGIRFMVGPHAIEFLGSRLAGGSIEQWVERRGPSPYEATLLSRARRFGPLDPHRTGGARLLLTPE